MSSRSYVRLVHRLSALEQRFFGPVSPEGLGLLRIAFGALLVGSLVDIFPDVRAFYSDEGILPRAALLSAARTNRFSIYDVAGSVHAAYALWFLTLAACTCFMIGWRTRALTVATFALITGMNERSLAIADGSDTVVRVMLFWFLFVPLGTRYSVDALLRRARGQAPAAITWRLPIRLAQIQFAWVYLCAFLDKWEGAEWRNGTALHYALGLLHTLSRPISGYLLDFRPFYVCGTYFTLLVEGSFLPLVFFPILQPWLRRSAVSAGVALHLGIYSTMSVGWFPAIMIAMYGLYVGGDVAGLLSLPAGRRALARLTGYLERLRHLVPEEVEPARSVAPRTSSARQRLSGGARRWLVGPVLTTLLVCAAWSSLPEYVTTRVGALPEFASAVVQETELWQSWNMFAPTPANPDVWLSANGTTEDGTEVDVLWGRNAVPRAFTDPGFVYSRWTKLVMNLAYANDDTMREFGRYLCRQWNNHGEPTRLYKFAITRHALRTPQPGAPFGPTERQNIWNHQCFDKPKPDLLSQN